MTILEADRISKTFRIPSVHRQTVREHVFGLFRPREFRALRVLDRVSFAVERGETLGIMGRNGSGKSTLLRIVSGIYRADAGSVTVRAPLTPILELGVGWNPELTAVDNILLLGSVMGLRLRDVKAAVGEILAFAELEPFAELELRHYSTGMAARLAYAVAFQAAREILVLDEILAVGDAGFKARCEARYRELRAAGRTVLLVSHDPRMIAAFCDRALLLEGGRILLAGDPGQVVEAYLDLLKRPAVPAAETGAAAGPA